MLDDLGDLRLVDAGRNLLSADAGRSLSLAYAWKVLPAEEQILLSDLLEQGAQDPVAAGQVVEILDRCGANLHVLTEIERHTRLGMQALQSAKPRQPAGERLLGLLIDLRSNAHASS